MAKVSLILLLTLSGVLLDLAGAVVLALRWAHDALERMIVMAPKLDCEVVRAAPRRFRGVCAAADLAPCYFALDHATRIATEIREEAANWSRLRVHFVDLGPRDAARTVVCLHGELLWSYAYREVARRMAAAGHRVVLLDLLGCGRSDAPVDDGAISCALQVAVVSQLFEVLDLEGATLVAQGASGAIAQGALRCLGHRVSSCVFLDAIGEPFHAAEPLLSSLLTALFRANACAVLRLYRRRLPVSSVICAGVGVRKELSEGDVAAYDAPYPSWRHKAMLLGWMQLQSKKQLAFDQNWTRKFLTKRVLVLSAADDPLRTPEMALAAARDIFRSSSDLRFQVIENAGHFALESRPAEVAAAIAAFLDEEPRDRRPRRGSGSPSGGWGSPRQGSGWAGRAGRSSGSGGSGGSGGASGASGASGAGGAGPRPPNVS